MRGSTSSLARSPQGPRPGRRLPRGGLLVGVLLGIATLLGACGGESASRELNASLQAPPETVAADSMAGLGYTGDLSVASREPSEDPADPAGDPAPTRKLIQNATIRLEVESCEEARRAVDAKLAEAGGYLSSANVDHREGRVSRATLVLRIPVTALGSTLEALGRLGTVTHESLTTQDITEEFFDVEARLGNARKLEERLNELLATEAEALTDLLEVERELARVRETIEVFEGRLRLWREQVAFSTITVELATIYRYAAAPPRTLGELVVRTLSDSWQALVGLGRGLILVVVAILPWIVPMALAVWILVAIVRRLGRRVVVATSAPKAGEDAKSG